MAKKAKRSPEVVDPSIALDGGDIKKTKATWKVVKSNLKIFGHYTLEDRAVCRVFDGFNPAQRRILWTLWSLKRHSKAIPVKCATVIGKTIGEFHPHGDQSAYGTLVKLGWKRYPLVQKHGNFGSDSGLVSDPPAAPRYTETRLSEFGDRVFDDIDVVSLVKSFTDEHDEPEILPVRVPITLLNGSMGIALGLSPHIPPHNLGEVVKACIHLVENPECSTLDLTKFIKGPDYGPNSGIITSTKKELQALYVAGEGKVAFSCAYHLEEGKQSNKLVITGKAPGFSTNKLISVTKGLQDKKLLEAAANDEGSLEDPVRITVEYKDFTIIRDRVLPLLTSSQSYRFYALDAENKPRRYDLKRMLEDFIEFRRAIETAVLTRDQESLEKKLGTDEAKLAAILNIDFVLKVMKSSKEVEAAIKKLCTGLKLLPWQAEVILNYPIRSLMNLNRSTIEGRIKDLKEKIKVIKKDLKNIDGVIVRRLHEMEKYSDSRGMPIGKDKLAFDEDAADTSGPGFEWLAMTDAGKVERFDSLPTKSKASWNYVSFEPAGDPVLVVLDNNTAVIESVSYLDRVKLKSSKVVGALPCSSYTTAVIVADDGSYCALDLTKAKSSRRTLTIFRNLGSRKIRHVVGLGKSDKLTVLYEEGDLRSFKIKDLKVGRPNINPRPLSKEFKGVKVLNAWGMGKSDWLCSTSGEELGSGEEIDPKGTYWVVGSTNLAILASGKRMKVPSKMVLDFIEGTKYKVTRIVRLPKKGKK